MLVCYKHINAFLTTLIVFLLLQQIAGVFNIFASNNYPPDYSCIDSLSEADETVSASRTNKELEKYFADLLGCKDTDITLGSNQFSGNWSQICSDLQIALVSSCYAIVTPNGTLTLEGDRVLQCVHDSVTLAGNASVLSRLPFSVVVDKLQSLGEITGCVNTIKWGLIGNVSDLRNIINQLS